MVGSSIIEQPAILLKKHYLDPLEVTVEICKTTAGFLSLPQSVWHRNYSVPRIIQQQFSVTFHFIQQNNNTQVLLSIRNNLSFEEPQFLKFS